MTFAFCAAPLLGGSPLAGQHGHGRMRESSFMGERCVRLGKRAMSGTLSMQLGRAVVAGGTGFIGSRLVRKLVEKGVDVTVLTRSERSASHLPSEVTVQTWSPGAGPGGVVGLDNVLRKADLVVNLCGAPVVSRWDTNGKDRILKSRLYPTAALVRAVTNLAESDRPRCVVSPSAVGYYGTSISATFDEGGALAKDDFLADLCRQWEDAAAPLRDLSGTRLVIVRIGVVMGLGGGALARMLPVFQLGLGGKVGSGTQYVSWIHIDDLIAMIIAAGESDTAVGVYNATSPNAVTMGELSEALARALNRPNLFPVPGFVLRLAFGQSADVVLKGQRVVPNHWLTEGFKFIHPEIDDAMKAIAREASA